MNVHASVVPWKRIGNMKKTTLSLILISAFAILLCGIASAQDVRVSVEPSTLYVNSSGVFKITVSASSQIEKMSEYPTLGALRWQGNVSPAFSRSNINGVITAQTTLSRSFIAVKEGNYVIPSMTLVLENGQTLTSEPLNITIKPPPTLKELAVDTSQPYFAVLNVGDSENKRENYYTGEVINLTLDLYLRSGSGAEPDTLPAFSTANDVTLHFLNFASVNPKYPSFSAIDITRMNLDGQNFTRYSFITAFRVLTPGALDITANLNVGISDKRDFFAMRSPKRVTTGTNINVIRPPVPGKDVPVSCGLIGDYRIVSSLTEAPYKAGDPLTLSIKIHGETPPDAFKAPELQLEGFRVYPPETSNSDLNTAIVKYTLIPYGEGKKNIDFAFSYFDSVKGVYVPYRYEKEIDVGASDNPLTSSGAGNGFVFVSPSDAEQAAKTDSLLYLTDNINSSVIFPLRMNAYVWSFIMISAGIVFMIVCILVAARRKTLANDPAMRRRLEVAALKKGILIKLKNSPPEEIFDRVGIELNEYISGMLDLPRGSSLSECADALKEKSPELAETIEKLSESSWNPSMTIEFTEIFKQRLIKAFARFSIVILCCFSALTLYGATPTNAEEAKTAYDKGEFGEALSYYADVVSRNAASPGALYNLGNCYYKLGDLPLALIAYERALKLAPRSSDIIENLNLTRRKLMLEERRLLDSPGKFPPYLRDSLRFDEWLILLSFGLMTVFAGVGLAFIKLRKRIWITITSCGFILFVACGSMALIQTHHTYNHDYAAVVERNAPLYGLPSESGKIEMRVKAGTECVISERRSEFVRVNIDGTEGWMKSTSVKPLWSEKNTDF